MIKYAVCPGLVRGKKDFDVYYISAEKLIKLYNVNNNECIFLTYHDLMLLKNEYSLCGINVSNLIFLLPRFDEVYTIPKKKGYHGR